MGLKKTEVKKGKFRPQYSGLFGLIDKFVSTNRVDNTTANFPVPLNRQARKLTLAPVLKAEYRKAQAITLIRKMSVT